MNEKQKLKEVAALFLKLGIIGFEVPLPTSLWCEEVVVKKKWLEEQHFLDLIEPLIWFQVLTVLKWLFILVTKEQGGRD
jgi:hypothetical protein